MFGLNSRKLYCFQALVFFCFGLLSPSNALALEQEPDGKVAQWSGQNWGIVKVLPKIVKYSDQVHIHGIVVGGPASDPFWSCSQYNAWNPNGTSGLHLTVPGTWDMPFTGHDIFGNKVNVMNRDGGEPPPYGWEDRISDTCYCVVTDFGANGGCESREVRPMLFRMMDQSNPREGNVQFATVLAGSGWTAVSATFSGYVGVGWSDWAIGYVYVVSDESQLDEDTDGDGLSDAWEYAHSPNQSLDDFGGGPVQTTTDMTLWQTNGEWINPYAPGEPGWVPVSINDWDGDGLSNMTEFLNWKSDTKDAAGYPCDPTYINSLGSASFPFNLYLPAIMSGRASEK